MNSNASCCLTIDFNGKDMIWPAGHCKFDENLTCIFRIWKREMIGQVPGDVEIIGILHQTGQISKDPGPNDKVSHNILFLVSD